MRFGVSGSISNESLRSSAWTESGMFVSLKPPLKSHCNVMFYNRSFIKLWRDFEFPISLTNAHIQTSDIGMIESYLDFCDDLKKKISL